MDALLSVKFKHIIIAQMFLVFAHLFVMIQSSSEWKNVMMETALTVMDALQIVWYSLVSIVVASLVTVHCFVDLLG